MTEHEQTLFVGAPRSAGCHKTVEVITGKLLRLGVFAGERMLDVGCGNGVFTQALAGKFEEAHGIDVQENFLQQFREEVKGNGKFIVSNMSASAMSFPAEHFDTVVTIETLEHIPDLEGAASEICRVLRPGGELVITVPNRWFPFENHGISFRGRQIHGRIPLLTYLPWLHHRFALARVFTVRSLDDLFVSRGLQRHAIDYAWPTFEHGGNPLQWLFKPLFGVMRRLERSPVRMFGSSVITRYTKPNRVQHG